jgi:hypothetical protein
MSKKSAKLPVRLPPGQPKTHGGYSYLTTGKLPEHRREVSRYLSGIRAGLIQDLGPKEDDLTTGQKILVNSIIGKVGVIRCIEEFVRERGVFKDLVLEPALSGHYLAFSNSVRLDLTALGIDKRAAAKVLDLGEYIQAADAAKIEKDKATASNPQAIAPLRAQDEEIPGAGTSPELGKGGLGDDGQGKGKDGSADDELPAGVAEPEISALGYHAGDVVCGESRIAAVEPGHGIDDGPGSGLTDEEPPK